MAVRLQWDREGVVGEVGGLAWQGGAPQSQSKHRFHPGSGSNAGSLCNAMVNQPAARLNQLLDARLNTKPGARPEKRLDARLDMQPEAQPQKRLDARLARQAIGREIGTDKEW